MKTTRFNHSRDGLPAFGSGETDAFARERYEGLLRAAEQYRLEHALPTGEHPARRMLKSPFAHLLIWAGILRAG